MDFKVALISGGIAGFTVDSVLYPLDTLKTRLQSAKGFLKSGGFRNIYSGISTIAIGSAPSSSLFFLTHESAKRYISALSNRNDLNLSVGTISIASSSLGEAVACLVRVPMELVKQRQQARIYKGFYAGIKDIFRERGLSGFYQGYWTTIARDIPFCSIQFYIYETLKFNRLKKEEDRNFLGIHETAAFGIFAGGVAGALTTPLDVIKTRRMLYLEGKTLNCSSTKPRNSYYQLVTGIIKDEGFGKLFSGLAPRTIWISLGGAVFLSSYEFSSKMLTSFQ